MRSFSALTYQGQFRRLRCLAEEALKRYDLGDTLRVTPIRHMENATFRVDAPAIGRRFCLRVHRPDYQTPAAIRSELVLLGALCRDAGLCVSEPLAARDGTFVVATASWEEVPGERCVTLLGWVEGRFLRNRLPLATIARTGAFLARLHTFLTGFSPPSDFVRPLLEDELFLGRTLAQSLDEAGAYVAPGERGAIEAADALARRVRERLGREQPVFGLVHGDFHRGNFLVGAGGEIRAIDFDDCGWGHYLTDIANATESYLARPDGDVLVQAFLHGYQTIRPLSPEERELLPIFYFARRLTVLRWIVARADNPRLRAMTPRYAAVCVHTARNLLHRPSPSPV